MTSSFISKRFNIIPDILYSVFFISVIFSGLEAQQCMQPTRFTWEGAVNGNRAVWKVNDIQNTYTNIGGIDVTVKLIDPFSKNTNTSNPSDYGDYTKTNTFFGRGNLAFQITASQANQPVCLEFAFSKHIFLNKFEVFDIDYIGSGPDPLNTYQDSLSFFAVSDSGSVALKLNSLKLPASFTLKGQQLSANYVQGLNGDLAHTDSTGAVRVLSDLPVNKMTLCYANGSKDPDGLSNSQAVKIMPFEFCEALGRISGRVSEFITNTPLAGSVLTLLDMNGNIVKDKDGFDRKFTTGTDGFYQFTDLPFGLYRVVQVNPAGYDSENDVDGTNDEQIFININVKSPFSDGNDFYEKIQAPLPVRFEGMSLKRNADKTLSVSWSTEGERNSDYFEISLSNDGDSFISVARVKAAGNTASRRFYNQNINFDTPELYVKLEQYDLDGKKYFLDMQYIHTEKTGESKFRIFPNPVSEVLTLEMLRNSHKNTMYEFIDAAGNLIYKGWAESDIAQINTERLTPGMYTIRVHIEGVIHTKRFMVVR